MVFVLTALSWKAEFLPMTRSVVIETSCSVYLDLVGYPNVKMYQAAHFLSVHYVCFIAQLKTKERNGRPYAYLYKGLFSGLTHRSLEQ